MGTAILRSHDCLQGRFPRGAFAVNPTPGPSSYAYHARRRKRSPVAASAKFHNRDRSRSGDRSTVAKGPAANLVMGQVKILKRGEKFSPENGHGELDVSTDDHKGTGSRSEEIFDLVLGSTDRLGPEPVTVQEQIRVSDLKEGIYAGSAFFTSPPPSSVPVPGFLGKNGAATSGLRRLLRLDLE